MIALFPVITLTWLVLPLMFILLLAYLLVAGLAYFPLSFMLGRPAWLAKAFFGEDLVHGRAVGSPLPGWLESIVHRVTQTLMMPLARRFVVAGQQVCFSPTTSDADAVFSQSSGILWCSKP